MNMQKYVNKDVKYAKYANKYAMKHAEKYVTRYIKYAFPFQDMQNM